MTSSTSSEVSSLAIPEWMLRDEASAEAGFAAGDYTRAALLAESDELRGCALVLLGNHEKGLPLIDCISTPRAQFFTAFALWGLMSQARALAVLATIVDPVFGPQARKLERLIQRPKIRILLQGREDPNCPDYDIVGAFRAIPQAEIKTVGYWSTCDVVIDHTTTLEEVLAQLPAGWKPDLFLSHMVEDYPPPIGIERAPFPTFCHTQDFDRHFHHCGHFLKQFDATIALGSADHEDFRQLTGTPAFVFPKLLGLGKRPATRNPPRRDIDVFVSGSLFSLSRQKAQYLFDVSQLPAKYRVEMLDGFCSPEDYYSHLGRAKATFTYVHRWGLINGRAIEAISVGTCAIYQEGGELGLFLSEEEGAIPYQPHNAMQVLTRVIEQWDEKYAAYAQNGMRRVAQIFSLENCIKRYFHFLAFCVTQNVQRAAREEEPVFSELRWPNRSPGRIMGAFEHSIPKLAELHAGFRKRWEYSVAYEHLDAVGESWLYSYLLERTNPLPVATSPKQTPVKVSLLKRVVRKLIPMITRVRGGARLLNLLRRVTGRPLALPQAASPTVISAFGLTCLRNAIDCYRRLTRLYPDRLAAQFNLGRLLYEKGDLTGASEAFDAVLSNPALQYRVHDLLFWREFQDDSFPYELMMLKVMEYIKQRTPASLQAVTQAILDSSILYLGTIRLRCGQLPAARQLLEASLSDKTSFPALWMFHARVQAECGEFAEAARGLERAVTLDRALVTTIPTEFIQRIEQEAGRIGNLAEQRRLLSKRRAA